MSPQADVRAVNITVGSTGATYDVVIADRQHDASRTLAGLQLPMLGWHNVQNSLAAIAVANEMGIHDNVVRRGARRLRRREAPLHPHRRGERRHGHRRLRPSPRRDRRRAAAPPAPPPRAR